MSSFFFRSYIVLRSRKRANYERAVAVDLITRIRGTIVLKTIDYLSRGTFNSLFIKLQVSNPSITFFRFSNFIIVIMDGLHYRKKDKPFKEDETEFLDEEGKL